jgi:hypothetical protein
MTMEWQPYGLDKWRLVDQTGCIVGRVERTYNGEFLAFVGKHAAPAIGTYVTVAHAKAGVERTDAPKEPQ